MLTAGTDRGEVVVVAPPEVDLSGAPVLAGRIARACALSPDRVVVDFAGATFCDSTVIEVLLDAAASLRASGCALEVRSRAGTCAGSRRCSGCATR